MGIYLKPATQEKEMFLKQRNNHLSILILIFIVILPLKLQANSNFITIKKSLNNYLENINNFSANFIQFSGEDISEGFIYIKEQRIKIDYIHPSKITIILAKNKAMYFNKDLNEVEYFNPGKTLGNVFLNIFYNKSFFNKSELYSRENTLVIEKKVKIKEDSRILNIFFETSPLTLRRMQIKNSDESLVLSISNINYNSSFEKNFFSMVNPKLK